MKPAMPLVRLLALALLCLAPLPASAATSQPDACPLAAPTVVAAIPRTDYQGRAGEPLDVTVTVDPPEVPPGFYITNVVNTLQRPDGPKPKILPGFPETTITCAAPGDYVFRFMVNLVAKSSCGGAKAATLLEREVHLTIR
jgi:hypothetical protein